MNQRILELAIQAREYAETKPDIYQVAYDKKFAELIVQSILNSLETEREYYANPGAYQPLEYYVKMSAKEDALSDAISMIRSDFGVEE
jgi:hypothetical protein